MSTEDEFVKWLERTEKSFQENLSFALKAWQSAEFTAQNKYEIIIKWITKEILKDLHASKDFPFQHFLQLFTLRGQPGLVSSGTKQEFVSAILLVGDEWSRHNVNYDKVQILQRLSQFELLQDIFRGNCGLYAKAYGALLKIYGKYLAALQAEEFQRERESAFIDTILNSLQDNIKRTQDISAFEGAYRAEILTPLVEVVLAFRSYSVCLFGRFQTLERLLTESSSTTSIIKRFNQCPLHVRLLSMECAIINRRGFEEFYDALLNFAFPKKQPEDGLAIMVATYTLEILRKHDINLNFKKANSVSVVAYLEKRIMYLVTNCNDLYPCEVLRLLCSALRLNPMILEHHVFKVTTLLMMRVNREPSSNRTEQRQLYEEYLVLLMDTFKRLSRAEKFVSNLLKAIKEQILADAAIPKKGKRKHKEAEDRPSPKKAKMLRTAGNPSEEQLNAKYVQLLFEDFQKTSKNLHLQDLHKIPFINSFPHIQSYWPSSTVGVAFTRLITGLVSKPSLVIWKTLLYALKDLLESLAIDSSPELHETSLFQLDLLCALICQYFSAAKLAEQTDKFYLDIEAQMKLTSEVLKQFGCFVLEREHHKRVINAFLESSYYASNFQLVLAYYLPDGFTFDSSLKETSTLIGNLHGFMSAGEWSLIQQRVLDFGKSDTKYLLNRLFMQRKQAELLLLHQSTLNKKQVSLKKCLPTASVELNSELESILREPNAKWLITNLKRKEKIELTQNTILHSADLLVQFVHDLESVELLTLSIFERLVMLTKQGNKVGLLPTLNCDFNALKKQNDVEVVEWHLKQFLDTIKGQQGDERLKKLDKTEIGEILSSLKALPLGFLRLPLKNLVFVLLLCFYCDLKASNVEELSGEAFEILTDFLHFGQHIPIFSYFSAELTLKMLPISSCWEFYEYLLSLIKNDEKNSETFLSNLIGIIQKSSTTGKLNDDHLRLSLLIIDTLSGLSRIALKSFRQQYEDILDVYANHIQSHFNGNKEHPKKDKKFVEKSLAGFAAYTKWLLSKSEGQQQTTNKKSVDEEFRKLCKIFIGHSMDYRNPRAIQLMQVALNNRKQLHLDQDEIELVLSNYWRQLNEDLKAQTLKFDKNTEAVIKLIIAYKTNEDFLLTMRTIAENAQKEETSKTTLGLLTLLAKCTFSNIKGAIFNEHFKQITSAIMLHLPKNETQQFMDVANVENLLKCQQALVLNKMVPISVDTLDSILGFLMDINIKKFKLNDTTAGDFNALHLAMADLSLDLLKHRHVLLMDRIPQFIHIFKDLLQALVWYKSDRQNDAALSEEELNNLAELAMKLEALMHLIATHSVDVRRVAPFVLTFVINLMVANKRPTTLYPKIKKHIESICYDLISVCDHRVGRFILRCSNEAARQVYEIMVKDHKKYHKFKGKV